MVSFSADSPGVWCCSGRRTGCHQALCHISKGTGRTLGVLCDNLVLWNWLPRTNTGNCPEWQEKHYWYLVESATVNFLMHLICILFVWVQSLKANLIHASIDFLPAPLPVDKRIKNLLTSIYLHKYHHNRVFPSLPLHFPFNFQFWGEIRNFFSPLA